MTVTFRKMKPGETIFGGGSGILMPFAPVSSDNSKPPSSPNPEMKQYTEAEIQEHLAQMKKDGYGTVEQSFADAAMRGLEGKPGGNG